MLRLESMSVCGHCLSLAAVTALYTATRVAVHMHDGRLPITYEARGSAADLHKVMWAEIVPWLSAAAESQKAAGMACFTAALQNRLCEGQMLTPDTGG